MTGKRYGSAVALRFSRTNSSRGYVWWFRCDCGVEFEATGSEVRYGRVSACPTCGEINSRAAVTTHGLAHHPLYSTWAGMKARCNNASFHAYKYYGGRGISVCARWSDSFPAFLQDMGERPSPGYTLERKDTNGDYEPANCVWATKNEQANNKRNNRHIEIGGETKTLAQWAAHAGVTESGIRARLRRGVRGSELLQPDPRSSSLVFRGVKKTLDEWAIEVGIKKRTLSSRIYVYGWPIERALTERVST